MSTLTIRNLPEPLRRRLKLQAASNGRTLEAEAREIIARSVTREEVASEEPALTPQDQMRQRLAGIRGIWQGQGSTAELMQELRGVD